MRIWIPYGTQNYGKIEQVSGILYVVTKFFHIGFIPLFPLKSFILFDKKSQYLHLGDIQIRLNLKSILVAYLRAALIVFGIMGSVYGASAFLLPEAQIVDKIDLQQFISVGVLPIAIGGLVCFLLYRLSFELFRASDKRARQLTQIAGIDQTQHEEQIMYEPYAAPDPTPAQNNEPQKRFLGMSPLEAGIVIVLLGVTGIVLVAFGKIYCDSRTVTSTSNVEPNQKSVTIEASATLPPTPTPVLTATQKPTRTPIAGWKSFEFWEGKAQISLPEDYRGVNLSQGNQEFMKAFRSYVQDDQFADYIEQVTAMPDRVFFAYDPNMDDATRLVHIAIQYFDYDADYTMDAYLNEIEEALTSDIQVVGREVLQLENYQAGRLIIDDLAAAGDSFVYVRTAVYTIKVDNIMWIVMYDVERDQFNDFLPVIEMSIQTFTAN